MKGILVGSPDLKRVKNHRKELKEGHDDRMHSISMMSFSIRNPKVTHYSRAYIEVFGKRLYLKGSEVNRAKDAGYAIHYE